MKGFVNFDVFISTSLITSMFLIRGKFDDDDESDEEAARLLFFINGW